MNLLAGVHYDPAIAATAATTSTSVMTAIDTTNLRLSFSVPPSGITRVRMHCGLHGGTTHPTIFLGVLDGSTVKGRQAPAGNLGFTAAIPATGINPVTADFLVTGLTPGTATTWDAAYAVETVGAAGTGIKYGGPNDTTGNNAYGGFAFEVWDPCPLYTPSAGAAPTSTAHVKLDAIDDFVDTEIADIQNRLPAALVGGRMDASVGAMAANVITATAIASDAITDAKVAADVTIASVTGAVGSVTANVNADVKKINGVTITGDGSATPFNV